MFRKNFLLTIFVVLQFFSVLGLAIGVLPTYFVYLNFALQIAAILFFDSEYAILSVILSIPLFLALPIQGHDSFQGWKIVFLLLVLKVFWQKQILTFKGLQFENIKTHTWDKYFFYLGLLALLSTILGAPALGIKKIIFVVNVYLLYIAALQIWDNKEKIYRAISSISVSMAIIVGLGFLQFFATFISSMNYFWGYWATFVSKLYYGTDLYQTLLYSNSWFTPAKNGGEPSLRMFSILPDSHSFATISLFSIPLALGLIYFSGKKWQKYLLWVYIGFADLAIIMSGTKGVWVGMLAALFIGSWFFIQKYGRKIIRPIFISLALFVVLFALSPLLQKGVEAFRAGHNANGFIDRAESLYNIDEFSNATRLVIWQKVFVFGLKHPLLGAGFGNFKEFLNAEPNLSKILNLPDKYITAHSLYLGLFAEIGLLGLLAFLFWCQKILQEHWKMFRKHYLFFEDPLMVLIVAQGLIFFALGVYLLFDETLYNERVLMYFFLQLALSAAIIKQYE